MSERYTSRADDITAPARRGFAIAASDSADLEAETRAIYVGGGGDIAMVLAAGDEIALIGVAGGSLLPVRARRVKATGTSASHLVGLY
jgi:hypothetical protein